MSTADINEMPLNDSAAFFEDQESEQNVIGAAVSGKHSDHADRSTKKRQASEELECGPVKAAKGEREGFESSQGDREPDRGSQHIKGDANNSDLPKKVSDLSAVILDLEKRLAESTTEYENLEEEKDEWRAKAIVLSEEQEKHIKQQTQNHLEKKDWAKRLAKRAEQAGKSKYDKDLTQLKASHASELAALKLERQKAVSRAKEDKDKAWSEKITAIKSDNQKLVHEMKTTKEKCDKFEKSLRSEYTEKGKAVKTEVEKKFKENKPDYVKTIKEQNGELKNQKEQINKLETTNSALREALSASVQKTQYSLRNEDFLRDLAEQRRKECSKLERDLAFSEDELIKFREVQADAQRVQQEASHVKWIMLKGKYDALEAERNHERRAYVILRDQNNQSSMEQDQFLKQLESYRLRIRALENRVCTAARREDSHEFEKIVGSNHDSDEGEDHIEKPEVVMSGQREVSKVVD